MNLSPQSRVGDIAAHLQTVRGVGYRFSKDPEA